MKEEAQIEYKNYRNLLSTLMKKSKQAYYNKYLKEIAIRPVAPSAPNVLSRDNCNTTTNCYDVVNTFNNYLASIAENIT